MARTARTKQEEERLTAEILERVAALGKLREAPREWVAGRDPVPYAGRVYGAAELRAVVESGLEFWLTAGRHHARLERRLAEWYGVPEVRLANSGSSANLLAVAALMSPQLGERALRPGDEVLTVAAGFPTTVAPLLQLGLRPVFVDVGLPTANVDVAALAAGVSERTRAVVLAHTLGNPFELEAVLSLCDQHDLWLVEDNCDAAGATFRGKKTGTFGDLATLSFYPPHHMTTGEGGAVLCSTPELSRVVESLRDWGRDCWCAPGKDNTCGRRFEWKLGELPAGYDHKYIYTHLGFNLKMTDLQAAVGLAQLERLDGFVADRRRNWSRLRAGLQDLEPWLVLPEATPETEPSWFGFLVVVRPDAPFSRDRLAAHLEAGKVQTRTLFGGNLVRQPALTQLPPEAFRVAGELSATDELMNRGLWFGVYPGLTEPMLEHVLELMHSVSGA